MENINVNKILKESKDIYRQFLKNEASKELDQDKFLKNMRVLIKRFYMISLSAVATAKFTF